MTIAVHDFREDLRWGESVAVAPFWEDVYRVAIVGFDQLRSDPRDCRSQRLGIDDLVLRTDGSIVRVQKKARRPPADGSDIALEIVHEHFDGRENRPGWIEEQRPAEDYFAYGFPHLALAYVFPRQQLLRAWNDNAPEWRRLARESMRLALAENPRAKSGPLVELVGWIRARNGGYWTHSIIVQAGVLIAAVADTMTIKLKRGAA
jgi:hypothetical protein